MAFLDAGRYNRVYERPYDKKYDSCQSGQHADADRQSAESLSYSLLLTFVGFFVFIGNMGRIPAFCDFLERAVAGREAYAAIAVSQVISNVPAALLLSGFTNAYEELVGWGR